MPNDINEMKKFVNNVKKLVEKKVNNAKTDTSKKAIVQSLNEDGTANIIINGEVYNNVKVRPGLKPQINEVVLVSIPNNNTKDMFIDLASSTSTSGGGTNHTHSNLSILETITQALIDAWNSAVSHISDTIRHITSNERDLWNTVSNKIDNTEVVTTATPNKILKLDSNSKLPASITGNADGNASTATKLQTARNISLSGDVTGSASFDGSADASITTALSNTGVTAGTYTKVTVDTKGRVTAGSSLSASDIPNLSWTKITSDKPTTLSGYGIADGVRNAGNTPSIQAGTDSSKPSAGTSGRIYIATDTSKIYRDTGSSWQVIGVVNWSDLSGKPSSSVANIDDAVNKRHTQNTDTTLTGSGANTINTTGTGNIVDFKVNGSTKSSIDNNGNFTGNATTASKLQTARTISLSGDVTGSVNFDGSSNVTINATVVDDSHNHIISNVDGLQEALDRKSDITHNHNLANLAERNYTSLVGRPADDDFHMLTELLDSANDDELVIYDTSDGTYKKITRENLFAGVLSSGQYVFIRRKEEFTATEGQTVFNLTQGSYEVGTGRVDVYIWGNKQPPSAYTETSSTSITLANGVEAGTKVLIEYIQIANVMDYIHAQNHKIGGSDPLTPADIGASAIGHKHVSTEILDFTEAVQDAVGVALTDTSTIDFTYDDTNNQIKADVKPNSSNQKVAVSKNNTTPTGIRKQINFKDGTNISITVADNAINDAVDVTITNTYTHPTGDGYLHVPATGTTNNNKVLKAGSTAGSLSWGNVDWSELTNKPSSSVSSIDNAVTNSHTHSNKALLDTYTQTEADLADAVSKKHAQNTDNTLTSSSSNTINTTGTGNIVDFKVNNTTKSSIDNNGNFTGKSASADKLATARTITLTGDVTGSASFDGSANISINTTVVDDSHNHVISNIDNLQTILDSKAPLTSPNFTGVPTAPTAPNGTNTDQIATTKFVQNALSASGYGDMLKSQYDTDSDGIVDRAETADKLTTARTISLTGNVTGSASFDGSGNISINATVVNDSHNHTSINYKDTRSINHNGFDYKGISMHLKYNTTDGLNDGGTYHGVLHLTQWGDISGGKPHQLGFTDNGNIWYRNWNGSAWSSWVKIAKVTDITIPVGTTAPSNPSVGSLWIDTNG